jgi:hypothetical protein
LHGVHCELDAEQAWFLRTAPPSYVWPTSKITFWSQIVPNVVLLGNAESGMNMPLWRN